MDATTPHKPALRAYPVRMRDPDPLSTPLGTYYELSTHLIALEVIRRGWQPQFLRPALFFIQVNADRVLAWNMTRCSITSSVGAQITTRKDYSRTMLRRVGLRVAPGGSFRPGDVERALRRAEEVGWPVVVKPATASKGRGVVIANDGAEFKAAFQSTDDVKIVVEKRMVGEEARFLVVDGRCVAVAGRTPAHVIGDGISTVAELVEAKNKARSANPHLARFRLPAGPQPDLVPKAGQRYVIDHRGGYSTGADSIDLTDTVHPSYRQIAERAYHAIPALGIAGVDIIATDWSQPATRDNHIVVEINSRPGIGAHHFPWVGEPRNVAEAIVEACGVPWSDGAQEADR